MLKLKNKRRLGLILFVVTIFACHYLVLAVTNSGVTKLSEEPIVYQSKDTSRRKRSSSQLKGDIVELLIDLVKLESKSIELSAQIQQRLYDRVGEIMEKDKNAFFAKASHKQLEACFSKIVNFYNNTDTELIRKQQLLAFMNAGCST